MDIESIDLKKLSIEDLESITTEIKKWMEGARNNLDDSCFTIASYESKLDNGDHLDGWDRFDYDKACGYLDSDILNYSQAVSKFLRAGKLLKQKKQQHTWSSRRFKEDKFL